MSTCKRLQVGCVLISADYGHVRGIGYNGPPSACDNAACTGETGACGCIHAEANALVKRESDEDGLTLVVTTSPCLYCAGLILNSKKVRRVVYGSAYRVDDGVRLLRSHGVLVTKISEVQT